MKSREHSVIRVAYSLFPSRKIIQWNNATGYTFKTIVNALILCLALAQQNFKYISIVIVSSRINFKLAAGYIISKLIKVTLYIYVAETRFHALQTFRVYNDTDEYYTRDALPAREY